MGGGQSPALHVLPSPLPPTGSPRLGQCDSWAGPNYLGLRQFPGSRPPPKMSPVPGGIWAEPSSLCCPRRASVSSGMGAECCQGRGGVWAELGSGLVVGAHHALPPALGRVGQASCQLSGPGHCGDRGGETGGFVLHPRPVLRLPGPCRPGELWLSRGTPGWVPVLTIMGL